MKFTNSNLEIELSGYKISIAESLSYDGIADLEENILSIPYSNLYEIDQSLYKLLELPEAFIGFLGINMRGTPNAAQCQFGVIFATSNGQPINGAQRKGNILTIADTYYLLEKDFFNVLTAIDEAIQTNEEYHRWKVIELAKISNDRIKFTGLPDDNVITTIETIQLDIISNPDGSLDLQPKFGNLTPNGRSHYDSLIINEDQSNLLITEINDKKTNRYAVGPEALKAARRVAKKERIPKEDASKFLTNPQAFILNEDEEPNQIALDFNMNYRIIGMGEPYIGYFGSIPFDSPIAKILSENGSAEITQATRESIKQLCENKTELQIQGAMEDLNQAIESGAEKLTILGEDFYSSQFKAAKETLEKISKTPSFQANATAQEERRVLQIQNNDDTEVIIPSFERKKNLSEISVDNINPGLLVNNLRHEPKNHQIIGINWLIDLYENGFPGGILADDMGLGKTYQMIAFFDYLLNKNTSSRILIVAPTILIDNWANEIGKFIKNHENFRVKVLRGESLRSVATKHSGFNTFDQEKILNEHLSPSIILTTYQTLTNYQYSFAENDKWNFECIVFDEAHAIKNPSSLQSIAARAVAAGIKFKALLTGTPIENELRDLWALFDVFDPNHFGTWKNFRKDFHTDNDKELDDKLRLKTSKYILRRLKSDLSLELKAKVEVARSIDISSESDGYLNILNSNENSLTRMRGLKDFCLHKILAQKEIEQSILYQPNMLESFPKTLGLINLLREIQDKEEKVIIFAINRVLQTLLKYHLEQIFHIHIGVVNGDTNRGAKVNEILDSFKQQNGFGIVILSTLAAGVGLTITEANHVIHYERWWNPSKEDQASDRAYRIGQKKDVYVYHLLASLEGKTSFDEALHELISYKRKTAGFLIPSKKVEESELGESMGMRMSLSEKLDSLDGNSFEDLILKIYSSMGYECMKTPIPEHGADVIADKEGERIAIQCKYTENGRARDSSGIAQLILEADYWNPTKKVAATNVVFEPIARTIANENLIQLLERGELLELLEKHTSI